MRSIVIILVLLTVNSYLFAQLQEPTGRRLRDIVEEKYPDNNVIIGGTTGSWSFGTFTGEIMSREFSYVTPENDFKQRLVFPSDTAGWNWDACDKWIDQIEKNNQILRIHGPISPQCSDWAKDDVRTAEELDNTMTKFMTALCNRYNGVKGFEYLDVVNEVIHDGKWHGSKPGIAGWENPWVNIGLDNDKNQTPLYIKKAFEIAKKHAPDLKFIFNHHEGPEDIGSWLLIKETITYLREQGLRIDGIGWQAHVNNGWATKVNITYLENLIDWAHANNLEFHITEASSWIRNEISQYELEMQATTYGRILETVLEKRSSGKVGWNIWHIDDRVSWYKERFPALFDSTGVAKPAYYSIQRILEKGTCKK
jgi:GH35 family endo-1,4-beta-xylanase